VGERVNSPLEVWPDPGIRALEATAAALLVFCAVLLRGGRWPSFPSLPRQMRADPLRVAWGAIRFERPNMPETVWAVLGGLAVALFVGGPATLPAGLLGTVGMLVWLSRRRMKDVLRQQAWLAARIPPLADLFAAALAAGLQPAEAARTVARAFSEASPVADTARGGGGRGGARGAGGGPRRYRGPLASPVPRGELTGIPLLAARFEDAAAAVLAGAKPEAAWSGLAVERTTAPLAEAVIRAGRTGAPAAATVGRAARELREGAADALAAEVRSVGVRATAPLVVCFLPAFVFLGVLPTALGLLPNLRG
jgi:Type II secretion system (T2SS), protein F